MAPSIRAIHLFVTPPHKVVNMARITIDDCLKIIPNRFDLTLAATVRARQIVHGSTPMMEANRDKATVIALREMAAGKYGMEILARNRTDTGSLPATDTANENTWHWIGEAAGDTAREKVVSAQPA